MAHDVPAVVVGTGGVLVGVLLMALFFQSPTQSPAHANQPAQRFAPPPPPPRPIVPPPLPPSPRSSDSNAVSLKESLGFIKDTDEHWADRKRHCRLQQAKQVHTGPILQDRIRTFGRFAMYYLHNWEPNFSCSSERRIGRQGDGAKWVCNPESIDPDNCLVYSVGSSNEYSFEEAVLKEISPKCEIHTFDPTVKHPTPPPGVKYHNWGINSKDGQFNIRGKPGIMMGKTVETTVKELGHTGRVIDIFKIDCEGCEFSVFRSFYGKGFILRQIQVEVHTFGKPPYDFFHFLSSVGYVIFHKEPNILTRGVAVEFAFVLMDKEFCPASLIPPDNHLY
eukprot:m.433395 g.433395  ORF g.433395 m.433395 type:complete len:335 (+) comp20248_c3_seq3:121-1125(+)